MFCNINHFKLTEAFHHQNQATDVRKNFACTMLNLTIKRICETDFRGYFAWRITKYFEQPAEVPLKISRKLDYVNAQTLLMCLYLQSRNLASDDQLGNHPPSCPDVNQKCIFCACLCGYSFVNIILKSAHLSNISDFDWTSLYLFIRVTDVPVYMSELVIFTEKVFRSRA